MRILVLLLILLLTGCSGGLYNLPISEYRQQVKTLGVLPLLVDGRSVIKHRDKREIITLLWRAAARQSDQVVKALRKKKGYFDVRLVQVSPRLLSEQLLVKPETDALGRPQGYQLNQQYLAELCRDSAVDGLLLLTLQGAVHNEKRWSRNTFETLTADYNDIMATATVVAPDGRVLWQMSGAEATTILPLQYPAFDEAYFNKTDVVPLKFIGLSGLRKTLQPVAGREAAKPESPQLSMWLNKVVSALSPSLFY